MSPDKTELLWKTFPNLYRDRNASLLATGMCDGFDFENGWFQIIWDLSEKLEKMILALPEVERIHYRMMQTKEKFGCLRAYLTIGTIEMYEAIAEAEQKSATTCELCGAIGEQKTTRERWIRTLCNSCYLAPKEST